MPDHARLESLLNRIDGRPYPAYRELLAGSLAPTGRGQGRALIDRGVSYGGEEVDLLAVEQVLDAAHAATLGHSLRVLSELSEPCSIPIALDKLEAIIAAEGLDALSPYREPLGDLIQPRRHELAAALNRSRTLVVCSG